MSVSGENYDIIIIGSGLGGLTSGALLSKAGKRVLIVERHDRVGGYAQSFSRRGFLFDSSVHFTGGCHPNESDRYGAILKTLELVNVQDRCEFLRLDPFVRLTAPGFTVDAPISNEAFIKTLSAVSPSDAPRIRKFTEIVHEVNNELRQMPSQPTFLDLVTMPFRFRGVWKYRSSTLQQMLDRFFVDDRIKAAFGSFCLCYAMPPSRLSFLQWTQLYVSMISEDASYCRGSFQELANALSDALEAFGGTILKKTEVQKIEVAGKCVSGVTVSDGEFIRAPIVISNADMELTYRKLMPSAFRTHRFVRRISTMIPTMSSFAVYIGTDLPIGTLPVSHLNLILDTLSVDDAIAASDSGIPRHLFISIPSLHDSSLAPADRHVVVLLTFLPYKQRFTETEKEEFAETLIKKAGTCLPDLNRHMLVREVATPRTFERYTLNQKGSIIGWEPSLNQVGPLRPPLRSPVVKGLYHVGHWTRPGGGVYGTMMSGRQVSQIILGHKLQADMVKALRDIGKKPVHDK